jgi:NTE family protein
MTTPTIGLALGSGSARGWAHIGIIRALEARGVRPHIVAGASVGALVGAAHASGQLEELEGWVRELSRMDVWRMLDAAFGGGGVLRGSRVMRAIGDHVEDRDIEELPIPFAAVATDLNTGHEVWLREGSMLSAVRASSGLPGLLSPTWYRERWLIDGGVVNPVPVSVCHALGADYVIAVNLSAHLHPHPGLRRHPSRDEAVESNAESEEDEGEEGWTSPARWSGLVDGLMESLRTGRRDEPGLFEVMATSISIMQDRITRSRMVGDPPDVIIEPDLGHFQLMDFHRADEAIAIGVTAVERVEKEIGRLGAPRR